MQKIQLLDHDTIDKIAAGEVVERPSSVVKELVENSMDAGADSVTVEIKDGGISMIRITDNGCGIDKTQVDNAFVRHATSKIRNISDLSRISSLGFRGEALSSIAAVAKVEMITKTKESLLGVRLLLEGADNKETEEVGAPEGTTIIVRNLFFNTPVRRKFLKQPATEGGYVSDLMEHMALSHPDISFKYIINGQIRFHTTGSGDLKEIIYRIYGRDIAGEVLPLSCEGPGMKIMGFLGKPTINRANRNYENYFVNRRFVKSGLVSKAIEEGYKGYLMQHKYPFTVLHFDLDTETIDVNVHPTKMDIRFTNGAAFFDFTAKAIAGALSQKEMIPEVVLAAEPQDIEPVKKDVPEPFEEKRLRESKVAESMEYRAKEQKMQDFMQNPVWSRVIGEGKKEKSDENENLPANPNPQNDTGVTKEPFQMELFEEKILTKKAKAGYNILGQIFDTYWLIGYQDQLLIMDQHAAHEKVKYEKLIAALRKKEIVSQLINPPLIVTLGGRQENLYLEYASVFERLGFEIESFGGNEYAIRAVPADLYGCNEKELFEEIMDELMSGPVRGTVSVIEEKIASMSCKAAVKGNMRMNAAEAEALIDQLLTLDNPYHCPHGRPTLIAMTKYELEKKFKRIV